MNMMAFQCQLYLIGPEAGDQSLGENDEPCNTFHLLWNAMEYCLCRLLHWHK